MKFLWTFEGGDRKPRKRNFDIKIAEGDVLSLTYFSIDEVGLNASECAGRGRAPRISWH